MLGLITRIIPYLSTTTLLPLVFPLLLNITYSTFLPHLPTTTSASAAGVVTSTAHTVYNVLLFPSFVNNYLCHYRPCCQLLLRIHYTYNLPHLSITNLLLLVLPLLQHTTTLLLHCRLCCCCCYNLYYYIFLLLLILIHVLVS